MAIELSKETHCKECGAVFYGQQPLCAHIMDMHMSIRQYYDKWFKKPGEGECKTCGLPTGFISFTRGYKEFCCKSCARKYQDSHGKETKIVCEECGETFVGHNANMAAMKFGQHLRNVHKMSAQEYYDMHLKKEGEGVCPICGKPTQFQKMSTGYKTFCSQECSRKNSLHCLKKAQAERQEYNAEKLKIVKTDEMIQEEWKQEIARRLAEFEGDRETMHHAESDFNGMFAVETSCLARIY